MTSCDDTVGRGGGGEGRRRNGGLSAAKSLLQPPADCTNTRRRKELEYVEETARRDGELLQDELLGRGLGSVDFGETMGSL